MNYLVFILGEIPKARIMLTIFFLTFPENQEVWFYFLGLKPSTIITPSRTRMAPII